MVRNGVGLGDDDVKSGPTLRTSNTLIRKNIVALNSSCSDARELHRERSQLGRRTLGVADDSASVAHTKVRMQSSSHRHVWTAVGSGGGIGNCQVLFEYAKTATSGETSLTVLCRELQGTWRTLDHRFSWSHGSTMLSVKQGQICDDLVLAGGKVAAPVYSGLANHPTTT